MGKIPKKYLPIGTVVMLKGATKRLMITAFGLTEENETKRWDYGGCLYPEGYLTFGETCLFDHEQIDNIYYLGLSEDEEEKEFKKQLEKIIKISDIIEEDDDKEKK